MHGTQGIFISSLQHLQHSRRCTQVGGLQPCCGVQLIIRLHGFHPGILKQCFDHIVCSVCPLGNLLDDILIQNPHLLCLLDLVLGGFGNCAGFHNTPGDIRHHRIIICIHQFYQGIRAVQQVVRRQHQISPPVNRVGAAALYSAALASSQSKYHARNLVSDSSPAVYICIRRANSLSGSSMTPSPNS